MASFIIYFNNC